MFLGAKDPETSNPSLDMTNLESTLKQLLERASHVPGPGPAGQASGTEESQRLLSEISNLKTDLQDKQKQIEDLKTATATTSATASTMSDEEKAKMEAQLKELQAKLSEYEIISEDIADLSFYKEQNAKLQKELEAVKGGATAEAPAPPPPETPLPQVIAEAAAPTPAPTPAPAPEAQAESPAEPPVEAPVEAPPADAPIDTTIDNELMAEFAVAIENQKTGESEAAADLGKLDMDKMMAEATTIKTDVPDINPEQALGTGLDEKKLLQEAAALETVTGEDKKLMGEFENFVKKSES